MALKANKFYTASIPEKGVVIWDTTLRPLCVQLKLYDSEVLGYDSLFRKFKESDKIEYTTKSGTKYIIQKLSR
ncbi:hypothetical protein BTO06_09905 [Tenacibaculum sp. SZ-18]|uniref:hypothetical protein n=1 Tax=Tenacibaculum sp. SZ-18 TaxID=754423 RepID=UPI000C2D1CE6|nr:hypothetical protein [Tenacibaculum sp. SZ-18]AUC15434.1 hypothetical protein BTO06_09905 [Tenacibaculum sp. SZ-18]